MLSVLIKSYPFRVSQLGQQAIIEFFQEQLRFIRLVNEMNFC